MTHITLSEVVMTRPPCEAKIRTAGTGWPDGWHACGQDATVFAVREVHGAPFRVYFCGAHHIQAHMADTAFRLIETGAVKIHKPLR